MSARSASSAAADRLEISALQGQQHARRASVLSGKTAGEDEGVLQDSAVQALAVEVKSVEIYGAL